MYACGMNMNMFPNMNFNSNFKLIVFNESLFNGTEIGWSQANKERRLLVWYTYTSYDQNQNDQRNQNQDEEDLNYSHDECQVVPPGRV